MKRQTSDLERLEKKARDAGVKVRHVIDSATGEVTEIAEEVETRILQKPLQSSVIALGIGLLLGAIFGRRL